MTPRQRQLRALARAARGGDRAAARTLNRQIGPAAARSLRSSSSGS